MRDELVQLGAQSVICLENRIVAFEKVELFPFANDSVQMLARVLINFRVGECLETFEEALADCNFFFAGVFVDFHELAVDK